MDLFSFSNIDAVKTEPLATRMRPQSLAEFIGQEQIIGDNKLLNRLISADTLSSMIFFGRLVQVKLLLLFPPVLRISEELSVPHKKG